MTTTSAEISVIRRPKVTRCTQDVMIEEEEEEEEQDGEDGGGDQSSFQSCTSSPLEIAPCQNEKMDSRLTEVEREDKRTTRGEVDMEDRVNTGSRVGRDIGIQSRLAQGETGNNTPSQKCPAVAGLGLYCMV